jgi:hypothetical protein
MNNEADVDGMKPSSKSRSKRMPALSRRHRGFIDLMLRRPKWKQPNAQKHGVFSAPPTIPGEDPREFIALHSALIDEWQPVGPTEHEAVLSLADLMWRKIRSQKFVQWVLMRNTLDPHHPSFDEAQGLYHFVLELLRSPELNLEEAANRWLLPEIAKHLKEQFPRANFQSTSEWAGAVINEILTVLLPAIPRFAPLQSWEKVDNRMKELREKAAEAHMAMAIAYAGKVFEEELNLRERLDAMIARQVKNLMQLKAMKQMLRQTSALREDEPSKRIAAPKRIAAASQLAIDAIDNN